MYGYAAFFTMDQTLPPFMQRNPVWPSTFPKVLSVLGDVCALVVLLAREAGTATGQVGDRLHPPARIQARTGAEPARADGLYALRCARGVPDRDGRVPEPGGHAILGERKFHILFPIGDLRTGVVWYLVQVVLGIFLRPWPRFL